RAPMGGRPGGGRPGELAAQPGGAAAARAGYASGVTNSRREKPSGLGEEQSSVFQDESVARVYHFRPPHPAAMADVLLSLLGDAGGAGLGVGAGTGDLGRSPVAADTVTRVDSGDGSAAAKTGGRGH